MAKKNKCPFCGKNVGNHMKEHILKEHPKEASEFKIPSNIGEKKREMLEDIYDDILKDRRKAIKRNTYIMVGALAVVVIFITLAVFYPQISAMYNGGTGSSNNSGSGGNDINGGTSTKVTHTKVRIETNYGNIDLELYDDKAPITVDNFKKYTNDGFYNGLIFHRVIPNFVIQGGGFDKDMNQKTPTYPPIKNEASISKMRNKAGTIAMARTSDPNSATSQFFINQVDNDFLDWDQAQDGYGYCVFGKVTSGMDVVNNIANVPTHEEKGYKDVPVNDVIISRIVITGTVEV